MNRSFYSKNGTKQVENHIQARRLYPVLTSDQLLVDPKLKALLRKIEEYAGLGDKQYEILYLNLILEFAEFVQILPSVPGGKLGGLLVDALERAAFALQFFQQDTSEKKSLLHAYAAFTAALFDDVGRVFTQQRVVIADMAGAYIKEWNPLSGFMRDFGEQYRVRTLSGSWTGLSRRLTPSLALKLLPEAGLNWLSQDKIILQMWLAVLMGEQAGDNWLVHLLVLIDKHIKDLRAKNMELPAIEVETEELKEYKELEDFMEWLMKGLNDGTISVNKTDSQVQVLDENNFLLDQKIFEIYHEKNPKTPNAKTLEEKFDKFMGTEDKVKYILKSSEAKTAKEKTGFFTTQTETSKLGKIPGGEETRIGKPLKANELGMNASSASASPIVQLINYAVATAALEQSMRQVDVGPGHPGVVSAKG